MRILYLSSSYVPSRRADGVQVMRMCAALTRRSHAVRLVTKRCAPRQERGVADVHGFYGVPPSFDLVPLPRPRWRGGGAVFGWHVKSLLRRTRGATDLVYCRDALGAWLAHLAGLPFLFEAHIGPRGAWLQALHRRFLSSPHCRVLVAISEALATHLRLSLPLPANLPVVVAPDAADPMRPVPGPPPSPELAGGGRLRAGYIGQLYPGKGVELLLTLAGRAPGWEFHLIGGEEEAITSLRARRLPANLVVHGFVPPARLPAYYERLDAVLLPYEPRVSGATGRTDLAAWMSPMKLFEAMAAGKAILASDLPVLREVLRTGANAVLLPPSEPGPWALALDRLAADPALRRRLGETARADLEAHHTWDARAAKVLDALAG